MHEIIPSEEEKFTDVPADLGEITEQILAYVKSIETSFIEIGKRLKFVRDNLPGSFNLDSRLISAYEQFGNIATSHNLGPGKVFEMLALPVSIDRREFIEEKHTIPSTGEVKNIAEMTREVTKPLKDEMRKHKKDQGKQDRKPAGIQLETSKDEKILILAVTSLPQDVKEIIDKYQFLREHHHEIDNLDSGVREDFYDAAANKNYSYTETYLNDHFDGFINFLSYNFISSYIDKQ